MLITRADDVHKLSLKGMLEDFSPEACLIINAAIEYSTSCRIIVNVNFKMVFKMGIHIKCYAGNLNIKKVLL